MSKSLVPEQIKKAMGNAAEDMVQAQLQLRCLQNPGWEVVVGGFGHDFGLLNTTTRERVTIEVKSRQALAGLTRHNGTDTFGQDLFGKQTEAEFLIFLWFDRGLTFIVPVKEMKASYVNRGTSRETPRRRYRFSSDSKWLNAWDQLFLSAQKSNA